MGDSQRQNSGIGRAPPDILRELVLYLAAAAAWLLLDEIEAQQIQCTPYDEEQFKTTLAKARSRTVLSPAKRPPLTD